MSLSEQEAAKAAGVRRLNKKPLLLVGIGMIVIVGILMHAIAKRGQAQKTAVEKPEDPSKQQRIVDSKTSVSALTKDAPVGMIAEKYEAPVTADSDVPAVVQEKTDEPIPGLAPKHSPASPSVTNLPNGLIPDATVKNGAKAVTSAEDQETKEEKKRIRQLRRQLYEQALQSQVAVAVRVRDDENKKEPDPAAQLASTLSSIANQKQAGLGNLAGLAGALGGQAGDPNGQEAKKKFTEEENTGKFGYLVGERRAAISPYEVKTGTIIPGVLITEINSDLPGMIVGQVSQNVYDTSTGKYLLIPQGTRIVGSYDNAVTYGQSRVLVAWNKLIFPDGSSLFIGNMGGADQKGAAGMKDRVNHHYFRVFSGALLLSAFSAGAQMSQPERDSLYPSNQEIAAAELGKQLSQVGTEMVRKNLNIAPTIEIRAGYRFNIMVNKDLILSPYSPMAPRMSQR